MANERKFRTNATVTKVGDAKVLTALSVEVTNVGGEDGRVVVFKRSDEAERTANLGTSPVLNKTKNGRDAATARVVLVNDAESINFGEAKGVDTTPNARGDVNTYVDIVAYGPAANDLVRLAKVGERISIINGVLTLTEGTDGKVYPRVTIGNYRQVGTPKVSKGGEDTTAATPAPAKKAAPAKEEVAQEVEEDSIPLSDDPFAGVDF